MIAVAPATHSFGMIHTELTGNATLFLGNPTYADAEWTLSHVPALPPKNGRLIPSDGNPRNGDSRGAMGRRNRTAGGGGGGTNESRGSSGGYAGGVKASSRGKRGASRGRTREASAADAVVVDDPSVFEFSEVCGVAPGVKLPLASSAACLPEDWNRSEVSRVEWSVSPENS